MKWFMRAFLVCAALAVFSGRSDAQVDLRAGGGLLVNPSRWGGQVAIDLPIGGTYPTFISPFVEWYRKGGVNAIPAGVSLIYKAPFSDRYGTVFFGVGAGLYRVSGSIPGIDVLTGALTTITDSSTQFMITAGGGLQLDVTDRVGPFIQMRWFRAFASGSKNEVSVTAGLGFKLGG